MELKQTIFDSFNAVNHIIGVRIYVKTLETIYQQMTETVKKVKKQPAFMKAVKPIRKNISLAQIKAEQNYKPVDYQTFRAIADEMVWNESLEELLAALK